MKRKRHTTQQRIAKSSAAVDAEIQAKADAEAVDALYGLEPVIELNGLNDGSGEPTQFVSISCPYCGESYVTCVDLANGACVYVEDCQVCCQPMELTIELDDIGALRSVQSRRLD